MVLLSKYKLEKYQYGIDVRKGHQLYGMSGKIIYNGKWKSRRVDPIIIVEMNEGIAEREAQFYLEVNGHNNIIRTLGYVENDLNLTIFIQEFAEFNDLGSVLMDNQIKITQPILKEMFTQVADAMNYVASKKIVHGDLGCRNVLVFQVDPSEPKNSLVKITDFGLARWTHHPPAKEDPSIIPVRFCAPEILRDNRHSSYSEKSDVYSLGVLFWEALSNGVLPYSSVDEDDDVKRKKLNNETLPRLPLVNRHLWNLMEDCWHTDPNRRPTFERIQESLSHIQISDDADAQSTVSSHEPPEEYKYVLNINVERQNLLGGRFGKTYAAKWLSGDDRRPIVLIEMNEEPSEYEALAYTDFEPRANILYTFGFVGNDRGLILLLQERAHGGNLQALLHDGDFQPSLKVLVTIFLQIVEAMIYVISKGIVHGDLRCANILAFDMNSSDPTKNSVKLANFGLAHKNDPEFFDNRRLPIQVRYCALEILRSAGQLNYSEYSDAYSMGVLMWEACSKGTRPYDSSVTNSEVRQRKLNGEKLTKPAICDAQIWSIMEDCWHNEPKLRFEFEGMKTRLSRIDFNVIKYIRCKLCNNDISENEMDKHQKSCSKKRRIETESESHVHFTRCTYCGERCLGSELEEHQESCPSRYSITTDPIRVLSVRCEYCDRDFRNNEILDHQKSCLAKAIPPIQQKSLRFTRCRYCNEKYLQSEIGHHAKSCPSRSQSPVDQKQCIHCKNQFSLVEIGNHEKICPSKAVIHQPQPPARVRRRECQYCHREYSSVDIKNHEQSCPSKLASLYPQPGSQPAPTSLCTYCSQRYPVTSIRAHEESCPSRKKPFMDQLCSWMCCCCAKD